MSSPLLEWMTETWNNLSEERKAEYQPGTLERGETKSYTNSKYMCNCVINSAYFMHLCIMCVYVHQFVKYAAL